MDPRYEQRLREEVIYLHSLWHQGPPRSAAAAPSLRHQGPPRPAAATPPLGHQGPPRPAAATPSLRHQGPPRTGAAAPPSKFLQPSNAVHFKRDRRSRGRRGRKSKKIPSNEAPASNSSPGKKWPSATPPPAEAITSSWGSFAAKPVKLAPSPSPEEQLKVAAKRAQSKALQTVREFFRSNNDDDADSDSGSIDSCSDEDAEFMGGDDGREEYTFFLKVLMEDVELKDYYEKNYAKGEFICLICGAVGGKHTGKKFKGCLPLVQHSIAVANTKRRRAHRAYGQAVCKIFGWDIDRLSTIMSLMSDNSDQVDEKADAKDNSIGIGNNLVSEDGNGCKAAPLAATSGSGSLPFTDKAIINTLTRTGVNDTLEGLDMVQPANVETVTEGLASISSVSDAANNANNTTDGLGIVSNVKETVAEGSTIGSLMVNSGVEIGIAIDDGQKDEDGTSNRHFGVKV